MPIQYAPKLPATSQDRMFSDAPPSLDAFRTSRTCADSVEVKIFTSAGITAPASVPQLMIADSFHHNVGSPPISGIRRYETTKVSTIETIEVSQTSDVSGASKFILSAFWYRLLAIASL